MPLLLVVTACSPPEATVVPPRKTSPSAMAVPAVRGLTVQWCDPSLAFDLTVGPPSRHRRPCDRALCAKVPVRNETQQPLRVLMQIEFVCERGLGYGDATTKRVLSLAPGGVQSLEATARGCKADDYIVRVWRDEGSTVR